MADRWPDLYAIGAAKSGTTSLWNYLDAHPDVFMCPWKDPKFFSLVWDHAEDPDNGMLWEPNENYLPGGVKTMANARRQYLHWFKDADDARWVGESTVTNLPHPQAAARIKKTVPDPKALRFLAVLREPVDRTWSHYLMVANTLNFAVRETRGFRQAVDEELAQIAAREAVDMNRQYVSMSRYAEQFSWWLEHFDREQFRVYTFDQLKDEPRTMMQDVADFLQIDPDAFAAEEVGVHHHRFTGQPSQTAKRMLDSPALLRLGRTLLPHRARVALGHRLLKGSGKKPAMDPEAKQRLTSFYAPEVEALEDLLGQPFPSLKR